jgi:hypothetical protein
MDFGAWSMDFGAWGMDVALRLLQPNTTKTSTTKSSRARRQNRRKQVHKKQTRVFITWGSINKSQNANLPFSDLRLWTKVKKTQTRFISTASEKLPKTQDCVFTLEHGFWCLGHGF